MLHWRRSAHFSYPETVAVDDGASDWVVSLPLVRDLDCILPDDDVEAPLPRFTLELYADLATPPKAVRPVREMVERPAAGVPAVTTSGGAVVRGVGADVEATGGREASVLTASVGV